MAKKTKDIKNRSYVVHIQEQAIVNLIVQVEGMEYMEGYVYVGHLPDEVYTALIGTVKMCPTLPPDKKYRILLKGNVEIVLAITIGLYISVYICPYADLFAN